MAFDGSHSTESRLAEALSFGRLHPRSVDFSTSKNKKKEVEISSLSQLYGARKWYLVLTFLFLIKTFLLLTFLKITNF